MKFRPSGGLLVHFLHYDQVRGHTHALRIGMLGWMAMVLLQARLSSAYSAAPGHDLFSLLAMINTVFFCLAAASLGAAVVAEEREEDTLGLLLMTGMRPLPLLLGKTFAKGFGLLVLAAIQMPLVLLSVTLGGVRPGQVFLSFLALAICTTFALCIGVFASVPARKARSASLAAVFLVGSLFAVSGLALGGRELIDLFEEWEWIDPTGAAAIALAWIFDHVGRLNPFHQQKQILNGAVSPAAFLEHALVLLALGGLAFASAWKLFPYFAFRQAESPGKTRSQAVKPVWALRKPGRAWKHALVWKDFHFLGGGRLMWLLKPLLLVFLTYIIHALFAKGFGSRGSGPTPKEHRMIVMYACLVLGFSCLAMEWLANLCRFVRAEMDEKTISALRLLPQSLSRTLLAKLAGCSLGLLPYLVLILPGVLLIPEESWQEMYREFMVQPMSMLLGIGVGIGYFALYSALTAWLALKTRLAAIVLSYFILSMGHGLFLIPFAFNRVRFPMELGFFLLVLVLGILTWLCLRGLVRQLTRHVEAS